MRERNILAITLLILSLVVVGVLVATFVRPLPQVATERAQLVDQLLRVLFGLAAAVFFGVEGLLFFAAVRGRLFRTPVALANPGGSLELLWITIPAVIVVVLSVYSIRVLVAMEAPASDPLRVEVTASQFEWDFYYPASGVTAYELHLPVGRPVVLEFTSLDVIHSFWVPAFGGKVDALPDRVTSLTVTALQPGSFEAVCAELCGTGHTNMIASVHVEEAASFEEWLQTGGGEG